MSLPSAHQPPARCPLQNVSRVAGAETGEGIEHTSCLQVLEDMEDMEDMEDIEDVENMEDLEDMEDMEDMVSLPRP